MMMQILSGPVAHHHFWPRQTRGTGGGEGWVQRSCTRLRLGSVPSSQLSSFSTFSTLSHLSQLSLSTKLAVHAFLPPASWLCTEFLILYKNSAKIANDSITMKIRKIIRNNPGTMNIHHSSADIVRSGEKRCPAKMYWPLSLRGMGQISMIKAPNLWHKLCSTWSFWYDCGYKLWWVKIETLCTLFLASSWICTEPPTYQVDETAQLGQSTAISSHKVISETVKETKWWS